jgi:hypothetical protein
MATCAMCDRAPSFPPAAVCLDCTQLLLNAAFDSQACEFCEGPFMHEAVVHNGVADDVGIVYDGSCAKCWFAQHPDLPPERRQHMQQVFEFARARVGSTL